MTRIFNTRFIVQPDAIDAMGHVNNLVYLGWMQDVAIAHSAAQGWDMARIMAAGRGWVARRHAIDYLRPAFAGDSLSVYTWIAGFSPRSCPRKYLFWRPRDGKVLATAQTDWVFVDLASGQPKPVPPELRRDFEIVSDDAEVLTLARQDRQPLPESRR